VRSQRERATREFRRCRDRNDPWLRPTPRKLRQHRKPAVRERIVALEMIWYHGAVKLRMRMQHLAIGAFFCSRMITASRAACGPVKMTSGIDDPLMIALAKTNRLYGGFIWLFRR